MDITPLDVLATALLDAPIPGRLVIEMFSANDTALSRLLDAMRNVVQDPRLRQARFEEQDLEGEEEAWGAVRKCLQLSDEAEGFRASKVTKVLHRKRPDLVPIFDSKVSGFYGVSASRPWELWSLLKEELQQHGQWIDEQKKDFTTPDSRIVSRLRALDIAVWMHVTTGCTGAIS